MQEYKTIPLNKLSINTVRDVRENVLETLKERIEKSGFNPAKPLSVIKMDDGYIVADGNHRLTVLRENDVEDVPCIVYNGDSDLYQVAIKCNQDEDTYAPMDLFDWLGVVDNQRKEGLTQHEIGDKIGWSRSNVLNHCLLLDKIDTVNLELAKAVQNGRVSQNDTTVSLNFTEGWFREITKLNPDNQKKIIEMFIENKGKLKGTLLKQHVARFELYEGMVEYVNSELMNTDTDKDAIISDIYDGIYQTMSRLERYITQLNEEAKNKLLHGDCLKLIETIQDESIALLLTDPPYGINYASNRREVSDVLSESIKNDDTLAFELFEQMFDEIQVKLLPDAHAYIFTSWKTYPQFKKVISKHMSIKNVIVWDKMSHSAGDLDNYSDRYELIIFAANGDRKLNGSRATNIMQYNRVAGNDKLHPTQKPLELLRYLIEKSTSSGEYICDPFMGVGSSMVACGNRNPYIGIELDERYYKIAKTRVNDNDE